MTTRLSRSPLGVGQTVGNDNALRRAGQLWAKPLAVGVIALAGIWFTLYVRAAFAGWMGSHLGWDFDHYLEGARRWLALGSPYEPRFVSAPWLFDEMAFVHPPSALLLFAPFLWLPSLLWWAVPVGIVVWYVADQRPSLVAWTVIALICVLPLTLEKVMLGNSAMWVVAFVALGLRWGWPFVGLIVKPIFAPLALLRARDRRLWIAGALAVPVCLAFGALWLEWLAVVRNFRGDQWYAFLDLPMVLIPVAARLGGDQPRRAEGVAGVMVPSAGSVPRPDQR